MRTLGVIVARKGSRGIPGKNMTLLRGKPLLWYTIDAAKRSILSRVIISTDCPEMAAYSENMGVEVPFLRPAELATDTAASIDVLKHAVEQCPGYEAAFLLQPTNPLRTVEDIDGPIRLMEETNCDSVIGYVDVGERHPIRMAYDYGGRAVPLLYGADAFMRRQELPRAYLRCGNVYLTKTACVLRGSITGDDSRPWIVPESRAWNIDEPRDLRIVEAMMETARECA